MSKFTDSELVNASKDALESLVKVKEVKGCLEDFLVAVNECISFDAKGSDREELEGRVKARARYISNLVESLLDDE